MTRMERRKKIHEEKVRKATFTTAMVNLAIAILNLINTYLR